MGPDNADELRRRGDDRRRRHDHPGRSRPALQRLPREGAARPCRSSSRATRPSTRARARLANRAYKFLNPALSTSERLFAELSSDSVALERFLVVGSQTFGATRRAPRRPDLARLERERDPAGDREPRTQSSTARSSPLPRTLRQAQHDLRQPARRARRPRSARRRLEARRPRTWRRSCGASRSSRPTACPVFADLADVVSLPGANNDLADTLADLPERPRQGRDRAARRRSRRWTTRRTTSPSCGPTRPTCFGWLSKLGQITAYYDANGHYARVHAGRRERLRLQRQRRRGRHARPAATRTRARSSTSIDVLNLGPALPRRRHRSRPPTSRTRSSTTATSAIGDCDPSDIPPEPMRRIAAHRGLRGRPRRALATSATGARARAATDDYLVRAYFDNAGFLVNGEEVRIAGANGRQRSRRSTCPGRRGRHRGRRGGPGQGGRRAEDQRRRLPGLPHRRHLPDPAAVAARREVRRLQADPAARPGQRAAARARGRSPTARSARASTSCRSRTTARPSTSTCQQHLPPARVRPLPADPQRPRRRPRRPRRDARRGDRARQPGPAADRQGARDPRRPEQGASPSSPPTPTRILGAARPRAGPHRRLHQQRDDRRRRPSAERRDDIVAGLPAIPRRARRARADDGRAARASPRRRRRSPTDLRAAAPEPDRRDRGAAALLDGRHGGAASASATPPRRPGPTSPPPSP